MSEVADLAAWRRQRRAGGGDEDDMATEEAAVVPGRQRALDRFDGSREDVPQQKDEDPGCDGREHRAEAWRDVPQTRHRQADEEGPAREVEGEVADRAERLADRLAQ